MKFVEKDFPDVANWLIANAGVRDIDWTITRKRFWFIVEIKDPLAKTAFRLKFSEIEMRLVSRSIRQA